MTALIVRAVLFDLDGTLVDSAASVDRAWTIIARMMGRDPKPADRRGPEHETDRIDHAGLVGHRSRHQLGQGRGLDLTGTLLAQAAADYPVNNPHAGWAETNPELWWSATATAVRQATAAAGAPISGIGLSGQMHGVVPIGCLGSPGPPSHAMGRFPRPRQLAVYRALPESVVPARLANPLTPGMAGPLLAWLAAHEPGSYRATRWALQPKDWIRGRLTGRFESEPSDASATLLYDIAGDAWDLDIVAALGLDAEMLPPLLTHSGCRPASC